MRLRTPILALSLAAAGAAACGGGGESGDEDAAPTLDAASIDAVSVDAPPLVCSVPEAGYGDAGDRSAGAYADRKDAAPGMMNEIVTSAAFLQPDDVTDVINVHLYQGFTVFQGAPIATGTYTLGDNETNLATCGVCVFITSDFDRMTNTYAKTNQDFMATAGTLVIDELGPTGSGTFRATLTNATFEHVFIDPNTYETTPANDGCETTLQNVTWSAPISAAM